jgi:hypothetical protein
MFGSVISISAILKIIFLKIVFLNSLFFKIVQAFDKTSSNVLFLLIECFGKISI